MSKMTYSEQLKHPKWQKRRLEILNRAGFRCESCEESEKTLHVHHKRYHKGAMAWEYADDELVALCEDCHASETLLRQQLDDAIGQLHTGELEYLVGFAESMIASVAVFAGEDVADHTHWPLRSYEHAWGFLAHALASLPTELVYAAIDKQPLDRAAVFTLGADAKDILRAWWDRTDKELAKYRANRDEAKH